MGRFPLANKSFGQHFLNSPVVIDKITSPLPPGTDAIVEIGPGPAVLTPHLAKYQLPLYVIEMDQRFVELLAPIVGAEHIYRQDALEFDWPHFLAGQSFSSIWLVSNLPYNVSVPLTLSFLRIPQITHMTLMYQKEVAQKIRPGDPKNAMGSLFAMCHSQFEVTHVAHAPPGAFVPPPKVDSQVLHFKRREIPLVPLKEIDNFEGFLRLICGQRRKQLGGILKKDWKETKTSYCLQTTGLAPEIRTEALTFKQVLNLYEASSRYNNLPEP
jgi:16S rRNA (adenine1518-N6/adenine1519-N6)-dimethyltransferase